MGLILRHLQGMWLILGCLGGLILRFFGGYGAHPGMSWRLYGVYPGASSGYGAHPGPFPGYEAYPGMFLVV